VVIATLIPAYNTKTAGMNAAKVLLNAIEDAIHVESFHQFTAEDLEEEMAISPPLPHPREQIAPSTNMRAFEHLHTQQS